MKNALKTGFSFGLISGVITTLGLIVGLYATSGSRIVILGGILTIAIADSFSDALGIHISEESSRTSSQKMVWGATLATLTTKILITLTFVMPILLLEIKSAVQVSIIWGLFLVTIYSYYLAKQKKANKWMMISEHISISIFVIVLALLAGRWISLLN